MPRLTIDELAGYKFDIGTAEQQVTDNGMPVFNGTGAPKMETVWMFTFTGVQPDGSMHIVRITGINDEARKRVVEALTGGVRPASAIDLPPGVTI